MKFNKIICNRVDRFKILDNANSNFLKVQIPPEALNAQFELAFLMNSYCHNDFQVLLLPKVLRNEDNNNSILKIGHLLIVMIV